MRPGNDPSRLSQSLSLSLVNLGRSKRRHHFADDNFQGEKMSLPFFAHDLIAATVLLYEDCGERAGDKKVNKSPPDIFVII